MNFKYFLTFCFNLVLAQSVSYAQDFVPARLVTKDPALVNKMESHYHYEFTKVNDLSGKTKDVVRESYQERKELLTGMLASGEFIFEGKEYDMVQSVFKKILDSNVGIGEDLIILLSRSSIPNAFSTGDGFMVVNLGLLSRLQNESQLAFILCHELAHQARQHTNTGIKQYAIATTDKNANREREDQINKILKEEYMVRTKLKNLFLPGMMNKMKHSRSNEFQADSLGYAYLVQSGYSSKDAMTMLHLLDTSDEDFFTSPAPLSTFLNSEKCPFNEKWIAFEEASSLGYFEEKHDALEDSLKTHPDCDLRIARIKNLQGGFEQESTLKSTMDPGFSPIQKDASFELIQSYIFQNNLGRAFYQCIHLLNEYPDDNFLHAAFSRILAHLAILKKERMMNKYVSNPSNDYTESYNEILRCLWNMTSADCLVLSEYNATKNQQIAILEPAKTGEIMRHYYKRETEQFFKKNQEFTASYKSSIDLDLLNYYNQKAKTFE